jgi:hypothetical protein
MVLPPHPADFGGRSQFLDQTRSHNKIDDDQKNEPDESDTLSGRFRDSADTNA